MEDRERKRWKGREREIRDDRASVRGLKIERKRGRKSGLKSGGGEQSKRRRREHQLAGGEMKGRKRVVKRDKGGARDGEGEEGWQELDREVERKNGDGGDEREDG